MDPSRPMLPSDHGLGSGAQSEVTLEQLLERQLGIADTLQQILITQRSGMDMKDIQTLANTASSLISLSHKTDAALKQLSTYRAFVDVVLEFLADRSDSLGEDLLAQLRAKAVELGQGKVWAEVA
jgi:hypothetical protein